MKRMVCFLLIPALLLLFGCEKKEEPVYREINGKRYVMTFEDEFYGRKLDKKKWENCPEWERQDVGGYWDNSMVAVKDGYLQVKADIVKGVPKSGAIRSKGLFEQNQGYFEISCQLQETCGYWFAFWLMDSNMKDEKGNKAEDGAEIDIMESNDYTGGINHAVHWDGYGKHHRSEGKGVYNWEWYRGFHTFSLLWTEEEYIFMIDGEETWRTSYPGMCKNPLYLKLTSEFGSWAGDYKKGEFPSTVLVDYIRVYALAS